MINYTPLDSFPELNLYKDEPMSRHTTFRIGGPADRLIDVENTVQLSGLLKVLEEKRIPWMLLGNGSDLLVADKGVRGAVLRLTGEFKRIDLLPDGRTVRAGAGVSLAALCSFARDNGLSGLEFAWGIPGSAGGAVYMNAGAYGGEMKDVVRRVAHMTPAGVTETVSGEALAFAYRKSRYTGGRDVILSAEYALVPGDRTVIAGTMDDLMERRKARQPYEMPSAGSVFKRPAVGYAAALIESCGLKGAAVGDAQVSPKHAGFIVNTGNAACKDVLELVELVRKTVYEKTGTDLECEIRTVGEL